MTIDILFTLEVNCMCSLFKSSEKGVNTEENKKCIWLMLLSKIMLYIFIPVIQNSYICITAVISRSHVKQMPINMTNDSLLTGNKVS